MSGSGGFAVSRSDNGDHIGSYTSVDFRFNQVLQQPQLRGENHHHQLQVMTVVDAENRTHSDDSNATLSISPFLASSSFSSPSGPPNSISNLDSFLDSVTPVVSALKSSEGNSSGLVNREADIHPCYCIGDLWDAFQEWSAYGAGVPFLLYGIHPTTQYYLPYLSGMQLYIDPKKVGCPAKVNGVESPGPDPWTHSVSNRSFDALRLNHQQQKQVLLSDSAPRGTLAFEYMEQEQPHTRKSLAEKASILDSQFPELRKYRSCDLSPSSWICVAWYPIYRIPVGPTLKDLEASFLTLHSLSTQPGSYSEYSNRNAEGELDLSLKVRLPVIGLASYKLKGSIISPCDPQERKKENALFEAVNTWLHNLEARLPDYQFFLNRY